MSSERASVPDEALIANMFTGSGDAFSAFYDRYAEESIRQAFRIVGERTAAEDVFQCVLIKIWRDPSRYDRQLGSVRGWVFALIRNAAIDSRRRSDTQSRLRQQAAGQTRAGYDPGVQATLRAEALALRNAISTLPDAQKQVLELAYFDGLSQQDIAIRLDKPLGTVKTRTRMGLTRLRGNSIVSAFLP